MIKKIIFKNIIFNNLDQKNFNKIILKKGLYTFPSGPGIASIDTSTEYYNSLKKADLVFFDSGFFILLLKILKNINVKKFSGYKFLRLFFIYLKSNDKKIIFSIDKKLLKKIIKAKPDFIMINIGGGIQEILGLFLKQNLKSKVTIICTGGAISFFTGDQAPINDFIDKLFLGWIVRLVFNPFVFFKRYLIALKLIPMVIMNKITTENE